MPYWSFKASAAYRVGSNFDPEYIGVIYDTGIVIYEGFEVYKAFRSVGFYRDGELVGFVMYGYFQNEEKKGRVWLDRYLIDERFQGQGLGKIMLEILLMHIERAYN